MRALINPAAREVAFPSLTAVRIAGTKRRPQDRSLAHGQRVSVRLHPCLVVVMEEVDQEELVLWDARIIEQVDRSTQPVQRADCRPG